MGEPYAVGLRSLLGCLVGSLVARLGTRLDGLLMAIETKIRTSLTLKNIALTVICLGFGIWGWYDYAIKIPQERADFAAFKEAEKVKSELEGEARIAPLNEEQRASYREAEAVLARFTEKPIEPSTYDDDIQLWVYIVGCGILGTPVGIWSQWRLSRKRFKLGDDGSLATCDATFAADQLADIDMERWMEKSIATVVTTDGARIELDDYHYQGVEDIVAALAARFHPGKWTSDARPIGDPKSRDTKKALAEAEAQAGAKAGGEGGGNGNGDAQSRTDADERA